MRQDQNQVVYVNGDVPQLPLQLGQLLVDSSLVSPGNTNLQQCTSQDPLAYEPIQGGYPITPAEVSAGVVVVNDRYPPGWFERYGALGAPTNDTAAVQAAFDVNAPVFVGNNTYCANNITQTHSSQHIYGVGIARITKNANGDLFTITADDVVVNGVNFRGDAALPVFTGHNVVSTGQRTTLLHCSSQWAHGRAYKGTKNRNRLLGSSGIYQSADVSAAGYDIELGESGTASLYNILSNFNTSRQTGGVLLIDTGSTVISGCQIGKLLVDVSMAPPVGVNGGMYVSNRIISAVTVNVSSAVFAANQFGSTITLGTGTSNIVIDESNAYQGGTPSVTNNGNADNYWAGVSTSGLEPGNGIRLPNNKSLLFKSAAGTNGARLVMSTGDLFTISNDTSAEDIIINQAGAGTINLDVNGARSLRVDSSATAGQTRLLIYDVDNATLERVTVGAPDSGGVGFKALRIPN